MATPNKNWTISWNNAAINNTNQEQGYIGTLDAIFSALQDAGWDLLQYSDGSSVDTSPSGYPGSSIINVGAAGSGTWTVWQSPGGFLPNGKTIFLLIYANDSAAPYTEYGMKVSPEEYNTDGTTSSLPTNNGLEEALSTSHDTIFPWTSAVNPESIGLYYAYSTTGDVVVALKKSGDSHLGMWFIVLGVDDPNVEATETDYKYFIGSDAATNNVLFISNFETTNSNIYFGTNDYTLANRNIYPYCTIWDAATFWSNGLDYSGAAALFPIYLNIDLDNQGGWLGYLTDISGADDGLAINTVVDEDQGESLVRVSTGGCLWLWMPTGSVFN